MVLAMYTLNIAHPGFLLSPRTSTFDKVYAIHQLLQPGQRLSSKSLSESVATADDDTYDSYKLAVCIGDIGFFLCSSLQRIYCQII